MGLTLALLAAVSVPVDACREIAVARIAGQEVSEADTLPVPCQKQSAPMKALRFDRASRRILARRDLMAGEYLGRAFFPPKPLVAEGQDVALKAKVGHVTLVRLATALQPARSGERYFVRLGDGRIVVAPAATEDLGQ